MNNRIILITGAFLTLLGCHTNSTHPRQKEEVPVADTVYDSSGSAGGETLLQVQNQQLLWQVRDSPTLKLQEPAKTGLDTMTTTQVIDLINANEDSVILEYVKTSHDTIFVHIPYAEHLTEDLGSTGAQIYMASMTYSLTSLKGIHYVDYDFVEGDHAAPGVYDRSYFQNLR